MTDTPLQATNNARRDAVLNRWHRDRVTNGVYTHQMRLDAGAYAYKTVELDDLGRSSYGLILKLEIVGELNYLTPVIGCPKMVFDYANLPTVEFCHRTGTVTLL